MKMANQSLLNPMAINYLYSANFKDMAKINNLLGNTYKRLRVISYVGSINKKSYWECKCECGNTTIVQSYNLISGHSGSCGCYKKELGIKHGYSSHQLYSVWEGMVSRCYNKNAKYFKDYGGRGIIICDEWRNNPGIFIEWAINKGWSKGLSIERNNVNGNYCPKNCTIIPLNHQQKNTRKSFKIDFRGKTYTQRDLAKEFGIHVATLRYRLKIGLHLESALQKKAH